MFSFSFENKMPMVTNKSCGPYVNKNKKYFYPYIYTWPFTSQNAPIVTFFSLNPPFHHWIRCHVTRVCFIAFCKFLIYNASSQMNHAITKRRIVNC